MVGLLDCILETNFYTKNSIHLSINLSIYLGYQNWGSVILKVMLVLTELSSYPVIIFPGYMFLKQR